jgi:hypothetical protein
MPFTTNALPWWGWLLCGALLAILSVFSAAFAALPVPNRLGHFGCLLLTILLIVTTLLMIGIGCVQLIN